MHTLTEDTPANRQAAFDALKADVDAHRAWYDEGVKVGNYRPWIHTGYVTSTARRLTKNPRITFESIPQHLTTDQIQALHTLINNRINKVQS